MAKTLGVSRITIYRWGYAHPYGTDGLIPNGMVLKITAAARLHGILLLESDWTPERIKYPEPAPAPVGEMPTLAELLS